MKTTAGVIVGVIIGIIVLIGLIWILAFLYLVPVTREVTLESTTTSSPLTTTIPTSIITPEPGSTPVNNTKPGTTLSTTSEISDVDFKVEVVGISGENLTRIIEAQLTNIGNVNASNCKVKIEAFSGNTRIKLNGEEYLIKELGIIEAGKTLNTEISLSVNPLDASRIFSGGVRFDLTISSDQATRSLSYEYQP